MHPVGATEFLLLLLLPCSSAGTGLLVSPLCSPRAIPSPQSRTKLGFSCDAVQDREAVQWKGRQGTALSCDTVPAQPGGSQGLWGCWANGRSGTKGMLKLKDGMGMGWGLHVASEEPGAQRAQECGREMHVKV